ncbi:hypothetical protein FQR65_LT20034 [Abscondita terminalis]|nr:hypothetical protein FQR65_LT20034 [Abscondita terminalis]
MSPFAGHALALERVPSGLARDAATGRAACPCPWRATVDQHAARHQRRETLDAVRCQPRVAQVWSALKPFQMLAPRMPKWLSASMCVPVWLYMKRPCPCKRACVHVLAQSWGRPPRCDVACAFIQNGRRIAASCQLAAHVSTRWPGRRPAPVDCAATMAAPRGGRDQVSGRPIRGRAQGLVPTSWRAPAGRFRWPPWAWTAAAEERRPWRAAVRAGRAGGRRRKGFRGKVMEGSLRECARAARDERGNGNRRRLSRQHAQALAQRGQDWVCSGAGPVRSAWEWSQAPCAARAGGPGGTCSNGHAVLSMWRAKALARSPYGGRCQQHWESPIVASARSCGRLYRRRTVPVALHRHPGSLGGLAGTARCRQATGVLRKASRRMPSLCRCGPWSSVARRPASAFQDDLLGALHGAEGCDHLAAGAEACSTEAALAHGRPSSAANLAARRGRHHIAPAADQRLEEVDGARALEELYVASRIAASPPMAAGSFPRQESTKARTLGSRWRCWDRPREHGAGLPGTRPASSSATSRPVAMAGRARKEAGPLCPGPPPAIPRSHEAVLERWHGASPGASSLARRPAAPAQGCSSCVECRAACAFGRSRPARVGQALCGAWGAESARHPGGLRCGAQLLAQRARKGPAAFGALAMEPQFSMRLKAPQRGQRIHGEKKRRVARKRSRALVCRGLRVGAGATIASTVRKPRPIVFIDILPFASPQSTPACPQCGLENTYPDATSYICPDCAFEWPMQAEEESGEAAAGDGIVRDANGNALADGDAVILVKDLKVKGSSTVLKKGSKIKGIRLVDGADGHNVDCKTELGSMLLKSEFLKKA